MLVTVYPNNEVRARIPAPVPRERRDRGRVLPYNLSIVKNLRLPQELRDAEKTAPVQTARRGYGGSPEPIPFSLYARRQLARCGGVFAPASEGRLVFLTGTLPGSTDEAMKALSDWSAWAVHELMTVIPRLAGSRASELRWEWVWEWQQRGALHWHAAIELPTAEAAQSVIAQFRPLWIRVIKGIGRKAGVDMAARHYGGTWEGQEHKWNIFSQLAYASPSNYLAKYLGKDDSKGGSAKGYYPSRWYGCSRRLLLECREKTEVFSTHKYRPKTAHEVTVKDAELLGTIQGGASTVRAFCDKYRTGFTLVTYGDDSYVQTVRNLLKEEELLMQTIYEKMTKDQQKGEATAELFALPNVDKIGKFPSFLGQWIGDLSPRDREAYYAYVHGQQIDPVDGLFLDGWAARELRFHGFLPPVKAAQAPEGEALTGDAPNSLESRGMCEQMSLYPGLPI